MNVDALNAKGKGEGKAGVEGWYRDPKENGKPSCAHCAGAIARTRAPKHEQSGCPRPKGKGVPCQQQQQPQPQQPHPTKGKKGNCKPAEGPDVQSLDHAWSVEEHVVQEELVSPMLLELGESEHPPWTVVRRK